MANRVLRDTTDSEAVNSISFQAEVLFYRLFMKADDFGSFHSNPKLIKGILYPLKDVRESEISRWLDECQKAGLIRLYNSDNKAYLRIINFGQRLRNMRNKFPEPNKNESAANCSELPPETETKQKQETETKQKTKVNVRDNVALSPEEILKLEDSYKSEEINWMYDKLSAYKLSKGKKYKSDYGAILTWVVNSLKEDKEKSSAKKESKIVTVAKDLT